MVWTKSVALFFFFLLFVVLIEVDTTPWDQSPEPVTRVLDHLKGFVNNLKEHVNGIIKEALSYEFNEVLSCCYLPDTGMNVSFDAEFESTSSPRIYVQSS